MKALSNLQGWHSVFFHFAHNGNDSLHFDKASWQQCMFCESALRAIDCRRLILQRIDPASSPQSRHN
jgi:hypothetical protein